MAVTHRDTRRRWLTVACATVIVVVLPFLVSHLPVSTPGLAVADLYARIMASGDRGYQGYVVSTGTAGLPELPQLGEVSGLLNGDTQLRVWYAAADRWRVDQIGAATERDLYQTSTGQTVWDFGNNQIIQIQGNPPVHLPRGADLIPPDLARRLLSTGSPDGGGGTLSAMPAQRIAGIAAAGIRLVPTAVHTTIASVDVWADPASGLPLQVEITGRDGVRPILASHFITVDLTVPDPATLTPPAPRPGVGYSVTRTSDLISGLASRNLGGLPATLAGQPRDTGISGLTAAGPNAVGPNTVGPNTVGQNGAGGAVAGLTGVGVYGTGLARFVVVAVPRRIATDGYTSAERAGGTKLTFPDGAGIVLSTSVFGVLVMDSRRDRRSYVLAGLVDSALLQQAGAELSTYVEARR